MKYVKIIVMAVCLLLSANIKIISQINPSFYTGVGSYTNLGGFAGIGSEVKYNFFSFNAAIGPCILSEHDYNFDVGIKLYSKYKFFAGINYGFIRSDEEWLFNPNMKDYYGFTFSLGYRFAVYKRFYGMGYLGASSDYLAFMPEEKREHILMPRGGFIIGYEFGKKLLR